MKPLLKNLLVFLITAIVIAIGAELYYRFLNPAVLGNTGSLSYQRWAEKNIKINAWGFRDRERNPQKANPNVFRIVVIGPSNVFGQAAKEEERITEQLEAMLNKEGLGREFEVLNMGTMTLDTVGTAVQITNSLIASKVEFDAIVLYYAWNSIKNVPGILQKYVELKNAHYQAPKSGIEEFFSKNSYAYDWLGTLSKDKAHTLEGKTYDDWHFDFYKQPQYEAMHVQSLVELDQKIKNYGAKFYILAVPSSYNEANRERYKPTVETVLADFQNSGLAVVDATHIYDGIPEKDIPVSKYDGHNKSKYYTEMAKLLIARMKTEQLK